VAMDYVMLNGLPALRTRVDSTKPGVAERVLMRIDVRDGLVSAVDVVIAQAKR